MDFLYLILAGFMGYIAGAIPFGFLFVKAVKGIDLRDQGSGRTGGTNSMRAAGFGIGVLTFFMDVVKGASAILLTRWLLGGALSENMLPWAEAFAGAMSVMGHNWSVFLGFRGGAGTGPNLGWATAVYWPIAVVSVVFGGILFRLVGMASVASLFVAAVIPITMAIWYFVIGGAGSSVAYIVGGLATAAIVSYALRPNIKRIMAGEERVVGPRAKKKKQAIK